LLVVLCNNTTGVISLVTIVVVSVGVMRVVIVNRGAGMSVY